jgi:hypothetical protein
MGELKTSQALSLLSLVVAFFASLSVRAAPTLNAAQKSAICTTRATCTIRKIYDAGKTSAGDAISVAEIHLGLKDKLPDATDEGCREEDGANDGGVEYWLLGGAQAPKLILQLCNDGYGASGVGEDEVTVKDNLLMHRQAGGSRDRWEFTTRYMLTPLQVVGRRECSYDDLGETPGDGMQTDIDFRVMIARTVAKDKPDVGCVQWPPGASTQLTPRPGRNLVGAYNIIMPVVGEGPQPSMIPVGTAIGDCVPAISTTGRNGFIVFGTPALAEKAAEIKVIAESSESLLIQVFDPTAATQPAPFKRSWINLPHVEVWVPTSSGVSQFGVDLNGKAYAGAGKQGALPLVERWQARDASGRPLTLLRVTRKTGFDSVAIVYSQAEAGKQARVVANTGIVKNRPLYLPSIVRLKADTHDDVAEGVPVLPTNCQVRSSRLSRSN